MTQKDINELFAPRILGCRMLEGGDNEAEAFGARMTRYTLETLREELLERARNERSYATNQQRQRRARQMEGRQERECRRLASAA